MTMQLDPRHQVTDLAGLEAIYGAPVPQQFYKEVDHVHPHYRAFIEKAPFFALATAGPGGLDCSPRGDDPGFARIHDDRTLLVPDWRGNNRADSLRNIVADPRVGLLFLIPGIGETLRVNGRAAITVDPELLRSFAREDGKQPRCVLVVAVESVYFQCARAIQRSRLWSPESLLPRDALPSTGRIMEDLSAGRIDGAAYDRELPDRQRRTLYADEGA